MGEDTIKRIVDLTVLKYSRILRGLDGAGMPDAREFDINEGVHPVISKGWPVERAGPRRFNAPIASSLTEFDWLC